jgi:hypothetical protein
MTTALLFTALLSQAAQPVAGDLSLQIGGDGSYSLQIGGKAWLHSAPTRVRVNGAEFSTSDGSLVAHGSRNTTGADAIGDFVSTVCAWRAGDVPFETEFRVYASAVVFEQRFPSGANGTAANSGAHNESATLSAFPAFDLAAGTSDGAGGGPQAYVQFAGRGVPTSSGCQMGPWPPIPTDTSAHSCQSGGELDRRPATANVLSGGWEGVGAVAVFDGAADVTAVISPHAAFTTTQADHDKTTGAFSFGPRGSIESVPRGMLSGAIVVVGRGVGHTMRQWGLTLMKKGGKDPDLWKEDYSLKYLGYTTDNGAYYYYNTEPGKNYEDTVLDLKAYTVAENIPIRWILYDSWFYAKAGGNATGPGMMSPSRAALNWSDADPSVFPSGLRSIYRATGWPVVAHARAWASAAEGNVYARADPAGWVESRDASGEVIGLPITTKFWDELFETTREWGCLQYQQDWMYTQGSMAAIEQSPGLSRLWHMQMTNALTRYGMRFGFGGVQPTDWLMSTEQQAVTNGRISDDYHANLDDEGAENWNIGTASIFGWALSVLPAKDGWWTTPDQPGHPYTDNRVENLGALHGAVATLSRGPVSPADKLGLFDRSQIMRSCMDDGTLLSPDRPALAIDSSLLYRALCGVAPQAATDGATELAASACKWSDSASGKFLANDTPGKQPASALQSLAAAQAWCCLEPECGGITLQNGSYQGRTGKKAKSCDRDCLGMQSWVKNPGQPSPPPPPCRHRSSAPNGEIWATFSTIAGQTYHHVLVPLLRQPAYSLALAELEHNGQPLDRAGVGTVVVENAGSAKPATASLLGDGDALALTACDRTDFKLYHVVPLLPNGWGLVGETAKWIPMSVARVRSVEWSQKSDERASEQAAVTVQLSGVENETISFGFVQKSQHQQQQQHQQQELQIKYVSCVFGPEGTLTMTPTGCVDRSW